MNRRDFIRRAAGGAALAGIPCLVAPLAMQPARAAVVHPFYGHVFPDLNDRQIPFASYLGKPVVLNFWATWCPPCVKEMPDLEALHQKHANVQFVGLAVDTASNVVKFGEKVQVSYPLLIAGHDGIALMRDLGNKQGGLPFTVVFDAKGRVQREIIGLVKPDVLEKLLQDMS
ncbi:TlpA family protein disulfide reductase [Allopusillimonas ginsengisoli]|uniref:TlpA family protein disulfide reductase n=1 Tax=Allopusillimonas ginsengisoli TaxID=453575 RepID=UPI00101FBABA|nr:TlpA disulfide reductase family protein [Allopusillimonas ginsengisoli]TEA79090.1 TlpA family protein disulfide reductase [Allopusillimonas ginsengisoli]